MDINEGFETKIVYDRSVNPNTQVRIVFSSDKDSRTFDLRLWEGGCVFKGCTLQKFNMDSVKDGIPFILKIYRVEEKISIEVDDQKKVDIDISQASTVHCYSFWRDKDIISLSYDPVSENVATQYRILTSDDSDADDEEDDNGNDEDDEEDDSGNDEDDEEDDGGNDADDEEDDNGNDEDDEEDDSGNDEDDEEDDGGNDADDEEDDGGKDDDDEEDDGGKDDDEEDDDGGKDDDDEEDDGGKDDGEEEDEEDDGDENKDDNFPGKT